MQNVCKAIVRSRHILYTHTHTYIGSKVTLEYFVCCMHIRLYALLCIHKFTLNLK